MSVTELTAQPTRLARISRAKDMEALSNIARDVEAMMATEHAPEAERQAVADAVMRRTVEIASRLGAG